MPENWLQPTIRPPLPTGPYVVAGVSRAGSAAALALKAIVPEREIWVYDDLPYSSHAEITLKAIAELGLRRLELEDGKLPPTLDFDGGALVKSPGIRDDAAIVRAARSTGMVVIDEAELGWRLDTRPQVGVTGTNGKSTTAMLTAQLLRSAGRAPIVAGNSTFGPPLSAAAAEPGDVVVAELSSFQLESCTDLMSEAAIFTNLTEDHIYRHGTRDRYADCKRSLFIRDDRTVGVAAIGVDQEFGRSLADELEAAGSTVVRFGADQSAQRRVLVAADTPGDGVIAVSEGDGTREIPSKLLGWHNALNVAGALAISDALGLDADATASALSAASPLPGRFELVEGPGGVDAIVDYAHNPDGVAMSLDAGRAILRARGGGSLIAVLSSLSFVGADQAFALGRAARERADALVLTSNRWTLSDRFDELTAGLLEGAQSRGGGTLAVEYDRRDAIATAVQLAAPGDLVMVLERGSAAGRLFDRNDQPVVFDDREVALELIAEIHPG
jgi:UDP-N-acetylmuramoylalanine-D-glutamate ligase